MKVILIEDVKGLGKAGDMVNAKPGYTRNFLLPRKMALLATPENIKDWKEDQKKKAEIKAENLQLANELKEKLDKVSITLTMKAGEDGKLFGSITNGEIADKLNKQENLEIDKKKVELKENIKSLGEYEVPVRVYPEIRANIKVKVVKE